MSPIQLFIPLYFLGMLIKSKSPKAGAIYDILWSLGIMLWGFRVMEEGGTILLLGIELQPVVFIGIVAVTMFIEAASLVNIIRKGPIEEEVAAKLEEEKEAEAAAMAEASEKLSAPCKVYIVHRKGSIGSANKGKMTLNCQEMEPLKNGDVQQTDTLLARNRLTAECVGFARQVLTFDAPASGAVRVDVSLVPGRGILLEENPNTDYQTPLPGQARVRPLRVGLVLWSISNLWCYLLGLVPLIKTLRASKHPFDDIAEIQVKSAVKWNTWMTALLLVLTAIIYLSMRSIR